MSNVREETIMETSVENNLTHEIPDDEFGEQMFEDPMALLSIRRSRLYADIKARKQQTYKIGKRRFTDPADLDRYVETCKQEATG